MIHTRHLTSLDVEIGVTHDVGPLPGGFRRVIEIVGGVMSGPVLNGIVLAGGADWNTERADGRSDVWARYTLRTDGGVTLGIVNAGTVEIHEGVARAVTAIRIEAPVGAYDWLNDAVLIGTLAPIEGRQAVRIGVFQATAGASDPFADTTPTTGDQDRP
ncbi:DUF3237 family protein [Microbacterium saperdae]